MWIATLVLVILPVLVSAQDATSADINEGEAGVVEPAPSGPTSVEPETGQNDQSGVPQEEVPARTPSGRLWSLAFSVSNVYDDNIDHNDQSVNAYGFVYGAGAHYQTSLRRPLFQMDYQLAQYTYPGAERWSRLSHNVRTNLEKRLTRRLSVEAIGQVISGGLSEEQEITNQLVLTPRVEYRLARGHRVRFYAAHRLKRYSSNTDRNATNRYVGLELQQRLDSGDTWEIGYRYEDNHAVSPRYRYLRLTYETGYSTMLTSRDMVALNVKYRSQRYRTRLVEVDDVDVPRHDQQW
ncbi:MAG: hypothetical protein EHM89_05175, partial [Acidobacteria bacterium]